MAGFVLRRLAQTVVVLLGTSFIFFVFVHIAPGDPIRALFGFTRPDPEEYRALVEHYGLDQPFIVQYGTYVWRLMQGELGFSYRGLPVRTLLAQAAPTSLRLLAISIGSQIVLGVGGAVVALATQRPVARTTVRAILLLFGSLPVLLAAIALRFIFGDTLGWLPEDGLADGWRSYLLPGLALGGIASALTFHVLRGSLREALGGESILAARARGLSHRRLVAVHALRLALPPVVALIAAEMGQLVVGLVVVEGVFELPGIGFRILDAINWHDNAVLVGIGQVVVVAVVLMNLLADLLHGALDPRVRLT